MAQDYYETLQVHPRADAAAIEAAYTRLRELYDPARLDGAADELVELARQKRDSIERAYAVLNDPTRRAAYDEEQASLAPTKDGRRKTEDERGIIRPSSSVLRPERSEQALDYRPLPPAGRAERPRGFDDQPVRSPVPARVAGRAAARPGARPPAAPRPPARAPLLLRLARPPP